MHARLQNREEKIALFALAPERSDSYGGYRRGAKAKCFLVNGMFLHYLLGIRQGLKRDSETADPQSEN
jgi:hypothetical protein